MTQPCNDDCDFEIAFYEGVLEKSRDFEQALMALGDLYTKKGHYQKGLDIDQRLAELRPRDPLVLYNLACSYALLERVDEAFHAMKRAVACGYNDFEYMLNDQDLARLWADERFRIFISKVRGQPLSQDKS
jgi:tetratricopeptide (TPR) repeat protein